MLNAYQLHVDTSLTGNVTTGGTAFVSKTSGNPFQSTIRLGNRHRTVRTIALKNAQIPIGFYNVRAPFNTFVYDGTTYTITPGNYTTLAQLNAAATTPGTTISALGSFAANATTGIVTFTPVSGSHTFGPPGTNSILTFLGFTATQTLTGTSITGTYPYTLAWDTYISIWIENIGQSSLEPVQISFKIPLSGTTNGVMFWTEGDQHQQVIDVSDRGVRVDRFNLVVLDRFRNILNNNGLDWSFSIDMVSDT
jgi:hypothetical protein